MKRLVGIAAYAFSVACTETAPREPAPETQRGITSSAPSGVTVSSIDSLSPTSGLRWTLTQRDSAIAVLEMHRARWRAKAPAHYRYWEHRWCFCFSKWGGPHVVTVTDDHVVSATDTTGRIMDTALFRGAARPPAGIDAAFDLIAAGIRDTTYAEVRVKFNAQRGFPISVTFDRDRETIDDEWYLDLSHFQALH